MKKSKKLSPTVTEDNKLYPKNCPICGVSGNYAYRCEDHKSKGSTVATYYRCTCGVIFQENQPQHDNYDSDYFDIQDMDKAKASMEHAAKIYVPMIEELTYGRMMLDVGFGLPYLMDYMTNRGWLTWGIDDNDSITPGGSIYKGDFNTYDFSPNISNAKLKEVIGTDKIDRKFDLIWMGHCLEHMPDPLETIAKARELLSETGVLYISTPDIDFINKTGVAGWGHWKAREHYIMWNERALCRELERQGFKIVMSRRNFSSRFFCWYDLHIICQKNYF